LSKSFFLFPTSTISNRITRNDKEKQKYFPLKTRKMRICLNRNEFPTP
jgi:hypothetical protein